MGNVIGSVGYVAHLKKRDKLKKVVNALYTGAMVISHEEELAWAVIKQAVLDIGWTERTLVKVPGGGGKEMIRVDKHYDSTINIIEGGLDFWFEVVGLNSAYVRRVFQHFKILKAY